MAGFFSANQGFLFTNVLQIPNLFEQPYQTMARIGLILFSILFIVAILHENFQALKNKSDYTGLFIRVLLVAGLLIVYERFFVWIVYGADLVSNAIMPHEEFQEVIKAFLKQPLSWKSASRPKSRRLRPILPDVPVILKTKKTFLNAWRF